MKRINEKEENLAVHQVIHLAAVAVARQVAVPRHRHLVQHLVAHQTTIKGRKENESIVATKRESPKSHRKRGNIRKNKFNV